MPTGGDCPVSQKCLKPGKELAPEDAAQLLEGQQVAPVVYEAVGAEPATGHEAVGVRMGLPFLVPGVEDGEDAQPHSTALGDLEDRFRGGGEERLECVGPSAGAKQRPGKETGTVKTRWK